MFTGNTPLSFTVATLLTCTSSPGLAQTQTGRGKLATKHPKINAKKSPNPQSTQVDPAPWVVHIDDGSHNSSDFTQSVEGEARWWYSPISLSESSSGIYSGGDPAHGLLSQTQIAKLWDLLFQAKAHSRPTANHGREMGSMQVNIESPRGHQSFIVPRASAEALTIWLSSLRNAASQAE